MTAPATAAVGQRLAVAGSVWLLAARHCNLSIAVWVGLVAVGGVAAETGTVMVVYLDEAIDRMLKRLESRWKRHASSGVSSKILQAVGVLAMVMGLSFIVLRPVVVLLPEDAHFTGLSADQILALSPRLFTWMGRVFRAWGAFALGFGAMIVGLARNAYARAERWAWWTLTVTGPLRT